MQSSVESIDNKSLDQSSVTEEPNETNVPDENGSTSQPSPVEDTTPRTTQQKVDECASPKADWLFCNGFDESTREQQVRVWDDYDGNKDVNTVTWVKDVGPFNSSNNQALRLRVAPGRGGSDVLKTFEPSDKVYLRYYTKWEENYNFNDQQHSGGGLFAGERSLLGMAGYIPDGTNRFTSKLEVHTKEHRLKNYMYYPGMYQFDGQAEGSNWGDSLPCYDGDGICEKDIHQETGSTTLSPKLKTNKWYCVELLMDAGDPTPTESGANGVMNFWVDNVSVGPFENMWFRTTKDLKLNLFTLGLFYHQDDHSNYGIMFDNVVVSKSRIGCL